MGMDEIPEGHDNGIVIPRRRDYMQNKAIQANAKYPNIQMPAMP
jgi:hypothetical protein